MSDFYKFDHECDQMPDGITFCKLKMSDESQFTVERYDSRTVLQTTVLYGFRYCPYCGEDMEARK